jgi:hypothetical protein
MWNGWKKAAIGLSALLAFVLLELMAVIGGVAVFLGLVMDVDLPFFAVSGRRPEFGWRRAQRIRALSGCNSLDRGKRIECARFPVSGDSGPFCAVSVPLAPACQCQSAISVIKIVTIQ